MVATVLTGYSSMLSAIISTQNSERSLVPTLSALVPAAAAGLLAEVIIADAASRDATAAVSQARPRRSESVSGPPQRPSAALGSYFCAPGLCCSQGGSRQPTISCRQPAFWGTLGEQRYFASPPSQSPCVQGLQSFWRACALRLPAVQGPSKACSSHDGYTMRLVGILQTMMPRPLSCAASAAKDWSSCLLQSR